MTMMVPEQVKDGELDVLNCADGHMSLKVGQSAEDKEKAKRIIADMLRRGYMIFVKVDGEQKRVRQFDPATEEYIIEEPEPEVTAAVDAAEDAASPPAAAEKKKPGRPKGRRVGMETTKATGIGPTAGG